MLLCLCWQSSRCSERRCCSNYFSFFLFDEMSFLSYHRMDTKLVKNTFKFVFAWWKREKEVCLSDFIPRRRRENNYSTALVVQEKNSGKIPFRYVEKKRLIYSGKCCLQFLSSFVKPRRERRLRRRAEGDGEGRSEHRRVLGIRH